MKSFGISPCSFRLRKLDCAWEPLRQLTDLSYSIFKTSHEFSRMLRYSILKTGKKRIFSRREG